MALSQIARSKSPIEKYEDPSSQWKNLTERINGIPPPKTYYYKGKSKPSKLRKER